LDRTYSAIQEENIAYSRELGIAESIRTTVVKPSGTLSLLGDCLPGIHPAYSRYYIRRVRFDKADPLVNALRIAGHPVEQAYGIDGKPDVNTLIVSFPCEAPEGAPIADEGFGTFEQLDVLKFAQSHWADQSVSVTVYYDRASLGKIQTWLRDNLSQIKTVSFLAHSDHGFKQAPLEKLSAEAYEKMLKPIKRADFEHVPMGFESDLSDCEGTACPAK